LIFRQVSEPSDLLVSTVFNEVILSKTVCVTLHEVEVSVIVACGSLKFCVHGGYPPCCSGGGVTSAVALKLGGRVSIDGGGAVRNGVEKVAAHGIDLRHNALSLQMVQQDGTANSMPRILETT